MKDSQHTACRSATASNSGSTLGRVPCSRSHPHCRRVHLQSRSIRASKCISNLAQLPLPYASQNSLNHDVGVHLQVHMITVSKWISTYSHLPTPSTSPDSIDHGLGVYPWVNLIVISRHTSNCSHPSPAACPDILFVQWEQFSSYIHILMRI